MKHIALTGLLPGLLLLGACAATPEQIARQDARDAKSEADLATALVGYSAGKPVNCFNPRGDNTATFGDKIVYRGGSSRVIVAETTGGCFGLARDDIIVTRSMQGGQLCTGDIISTLDRTNQFPSGSCAFTNFTPYRKTRG